MPPDEKSSSISELSDAFTGVQQLSDCRCSCGVSNQQAESSMLLHGVQANFCAFEVLRGVQDGGKRRNFVYVDPVLNLGFLFSFRCGSTGWILWHKTGKGES